MVWDLAAQAYSSLTLRLAIDRRNWYLVVCCKSGMAGWELRIIIQRRKGGEGSPGGGRRREQLAAGLARLPIDVGRRAMDDSLDLSRCAASAPDHVRILVGYSAYVYAMDRLRFRSSSLYRM